MHHRIGHHCSAPSVPVFWCVGVPMAERYDALVTVTSAQFQVAGPNKSGQFRAMCRILYRREDAQDTSGVAEAQQVFVAAPWRSTTQEAEPDGLELTRACVKGGFVFVLRRKSELFQQQAAQQAARSSSSRKRTWTA